MTDDPDERETRLLLTFCLKAEHYAVQHTLGAGANGIVFAVTCTHPEAPVPGKTYALKLLFNYGVESSRLSCVFRPEWQSFALLPTHRNVNRFLGQFVDAIPDDMFERLTDGQRELGTCPLRALKGVVNRPRPGRPRFQPPPSHPPPQHKLSTRAPAA
jgi:hypothetical protein